MRIYKILNNNAVIIRNAQQQEQVVMGRGLGFQKRPGDFLDKACVEKIFSLQEPGLQALLSELLQRIPAEIITTSDHIICLARQKIPSLHERIYLTLVDHLHFAIERHRQGMAISNLMLWDIQQLYPCEYDIGLASLELIAQEMDCQLPIDEAGFIALHLANAQLTGDMKITNQISLLMQEVLQIVRLKMHIRLDENTLAFHRFVTHLKFLAQRLLSKNGLLPGDIALQEMVQQSCPQAWNCAKTISKHIETNGHEKLSDAEIMYLSLHINRLHDRQAI
ncbi:MULTISPECIES: BglG family transcription antiterminator LicT [Aquitalea]|uniref:BglG family transcriptional antiterminator n=1 Tax=Aquitalea magnusonii TaxID=332411 RepID=A0A318J5X5_9NEIS|nr:MULTISPECIES: PRD domain-containing protein [Aquitalea]PXX42840.1 BglG family transcriptional antiterminator [Aquitalea magnusonii]